ncbi:gamma-glutamyltransferase [Arsenicicoccus piscis]|uniref:gamma-glutamyltransferase n=1 Tax=Arsenicicoccus piscis TaxID=673954 RepID=UPI001F4D340F|nr:gamma-glutamyltransferase [Arsenicicoccus piscis]MCH8628826.1 gamma-glutamyltransferase [Arsenicicoccus piscis]
MNRKRTTSLLRRPGVAVTLTGGLLVSLTLPAVATATASPAPAKTSQADADAGKRPYGVDPANLPKMPTMTGGGGAVSSVDQTASQVGIDVLRRGGNAADAAVATAAALGVTEPFANGIAGGGFFVYYDAKRKKVTTIDGRETAPAAFTDKTFTKADGTAMDFMTAVNSGLSFGVPGTPATWDLALKRFGTRSFSDSLRPAQEIAQNGFMVDQAFQDGVAQNVERFTMFPATAKLFMPGGSLPEVGTVFRNPDIAKAYAVLRREGPASIYGGGTLAKAMVAEARNPGTAPGVTVAKSPVTVDDLRAYQAKLKAPITSTYQGLNVYGMPVPSSGGIAVAEILNLLEAYQAKTGASTASVSPAQWYHRFAEASATAFADRNRYVGDVPGVPVKELVSKAFAAERACGFSPTKAQARPIAFGQPDGSYTGCAGGARVAAKPNDGASTTSLSAVDKWGNMVAYTLTIEQYGGSGITVPGYGFLLNNEMTDFNFVPLQAGVPDPNLPAAGKRPRSSMSPTLILKNGKPYLTVGSPGGATIITTVSQIITGYVDRGMPLVEAIAAPRLSSRNTGVTVEPELVNSDIGTALKDLGQPLTTVGEIGRGVGVAVHGKTLTAAAETVRAGGGSAMVVTPRDTASR